MYKRQFLNFFNLFLENSLGVRFSWQSLQSTVSSVCSFSSLGASEAGCAVGELFVVVVVLDSVPVAKIDFESCLLASEKLAVFFALACVSVWPSILNS